MWETETEFITWLDQEKLGTNEIPLDDDTLELMYRAWEAGKEDHTKNHLNRVVIETNAVHISKKTIEVWVNRMLKESSSTRDKYTTSGDCMVHVSCHDDGRYTVRIMRIERMLWMKFRNEILEKVRTNE